MKIKYLQFFMLLFLLAFSVSAQKKSEENGKSENNKSKTEATNETQKKRVILSFAKPERMFSFLKGKWIFADMSCDEPYTITVSEDLKKIKFTYAKPEKWSDGKERDHFIYNVLEVGSYYIRTQIEEEMRKTDDGKIISWDFMFISPNEFVWRRTDWKGLGSTSSVTRCSDNKERLSNDVGK